MGGPRVVYPLLFPLLLLLDWACRATCTQQQSILYGLMYSSLLIRQQTQRIPVYKLPKCGVLYFNSPAWTTSSVQVTLSTGMQRYCNGTRTVRWHQFIWGYNLPTDFLQPVRRGQMLQWNASVQLSRDLMNELNITDEMALSTWKDEEGLDLPGGDDPEYEDSLTIGLEPPSAPGTAAPPPPPDFYTVPPGAPGAAAAPPPPLPPQTSFMGPVKYAPIDVWEDPVETSSPFGPDISVKGPVHVYKAFDLDCKRLNNGDYLDRQARVSWQQAAAGKMPETQDSDSCYVTQAVVYLDNQCEIVPEPEPGTDTSQWDDAYVDVTITYSVFDKCISPLIYYTTYLGLGIIFSYLGLVALLVLITLPTWWRLLVYTPMVLINKLVDKITGRQRPMHKPFQRVSNFFRDLVNRVPVLGHILRARKHIQYSIATVHSADGQFRMYQVCIVVCVAIALYFMVWLPDRLVQINRYNSGFLLQLDMPKKDALTKFIAISLMCSYLGFVGYLAMLVNFNHPSNPYYLTQRIISGMFLVYLNLLVIGQQVSIFTQLDYLWPRWPQIPSAIFQLGNLLYADLVGFWLVFRSRAYYEEMKRKRHQGSGTEMSEGLSARGTRLLRTAASSSMQNLKACFLRNGERDEEAGGDSSSSVPNVNADTAEKGAAKRGSFFRKQGSTGLQGQGSFADLSYGKEEGQDTATAKVGRFFMSYVGETGGFRYPAWFLSAVLISTYCVTLQYFRAVAWTQRITDCVRNPIECVGNNLKQYGNVGFGIINSGVQREMVAYINAIMEGQSSFFKGLVSLLTSNDTAALVANITTQAINELVSDRAVQAGDALNGAQAYAMETINSTLAAQGYNSSQIAELSGLVNATLADSLYNVTGLVGGLSNGSIADQIGAQLGQIVADNQANLTTEALPAIYDAMTQFSGVLTTTRNVLLRYDSYLGTGATWQDQLVTRFQWSSVLGLTFGLILALWTLLTTMVSFKKALLEIRRQRIAEMLARRKKKLRRSTTNGTDGAGEEDSAKAAADDDDEAAQALLLANKARVKPIGMVVFFYGALMSATFIQLYVLGIAIGIGLSVVTHPWFWTWLVPRTYVIILCIIFVVLLNQVLFILYIGNTYLSDGHNIHRPGAWLAFLIILSITNINIGLFIALIRIIYLLITTIYCLGKFDVSLFTILSALDLPHNAFLAGLHMTDAMRNFHDPMYAPGPRGRAIKRWRQLRNIILEQGAEAFAEMVDARGKRVKKKPSKLSSVKKGSPGDGSSSAPDTPHSTDVLIRAGMDVGFDSEAEQGFEDASSNYQSADGQTFSSRQSQQSLRGGSEGGAGGATPAQGRQPAEKPKSKLGRTDSSAVAGGSAGGASQGAVDAVDDTEVNLAFPPQRSSATGSSQNASIELRTVAAAPNPARLPRNEQ